MLAAILGKTYTDLGDGVFSFTGVTLDGFDSQKAYLKNMKDKLGDAVDGDIPEADVYIALTFDDGPTGKKGRLSERSDQLSAGRPQAARRSCYVF